MKLAEILKRFQDGDTISDKDLLRLHKAVNQMADLSSKLGPSFKLALVYASQIEYSTRMMIDARERLHLRVPERHARIKEHDDSAKTQTP